MNTRAQKEKMNRQDAKAPSLYWACLMAGFCASPPSRLGALAVNPAFPGGTPA